MSPPEANARPSQVTLAGWGIAGAAVMLVVAVFDTMGNLQSLDMRDELTRMLTTGSGKGLGLSVDQAIELMRWSLFVSGVAAAAAAILGIFVLQRNRGARIGLTVAAVPIVLTAPISGSFLGMFIAAGTAILWTRPARDWFAGRPPQPATMAPVAQQAVAPVAPPAVPPAEVQPPPVYGWAQPPAPLLPPQPPNPYGYYPPRPAPTSRAVVSDRPLQVRVACILTWVFSALTGLAYIVVLVALAVDSSGLLKIMRDSPQWDPSYDDNVVLVAIGVVSVLILFWCAAAMVLAVFAWRGARWAWGLLLASIGLAALVSLVLLPVSLAHLIVLGAAFGLLLSGPARDWFAGR